MAQRVQRAVHPGRSASMALKNRIGLVAYGATLTSTVALEQFRRAAHRKRRQLSRVPWHGGCT